MRNTHMVMTIILMIFTVNFDSIAQNQFNNISLSDTTKIQLLKEESSITIKDWGPALSAVIAAIISVIFNHFNSKRMIDENHKLLKKQYESKFALEHRLVWISNIRDNSAQIITNIYLYESYVKFIVEDDVKNIKSSNETIAEYKKLANEYYKEAFSLMNNIIITLNPKEADHAEYIVFLNNFLKIYDGDVKSMLIINKEIKLEARNQLIIKTQEFYNFHYEKIKQTLND